MTLIADESVDYPIIARLRQDGFEIVAIAEISPAVPDDFILEKARTQKLLLLTGDKDFGELVFREKLVSEGVVLVRLSGLKPETKAELVSTNFRQHANEFIGNFSVISPGMLRVRKRND
ncbi:MAG: hypothetical protein JWO95_2507 [Verrucomicrobiales bacterium]|nr:hypothetical protein [Verrucomicrobiales bacterium]